MPDQVFPVVCAQCATSTGQPYRTAAAPAGATLVGVRCSTCHQEWEIGRPAAPSFLIAPPITPDTATLEPAIGAARDLRRGDHVCAMYSTRSELVETAAEFIVGGLRLRQRCWYVTCGPEIEAVRIELERRQVDVARETAKGALDLISGDGTYLTCDTFDPERVMQNFNEAIENAYRDGFTGFRAAADMSWALDLEGGPQPLIVYEAMLRALFSTSRATGLCLYDRTRMPMDVIDGALATHPVVCAGGAYAVNAFYEPSRTHAVAVDGAAVLDKLRQIDSQARPS